jgi:hypothetical protein
MIKKHINFIGNLIAETLLCLLTIFITLKLCKIIDWSWFFVLSPFLFPLFIALIMLVIYLIKYKLNKNTNYGRKY